MATGSAEVMFRSVFEGIISTEDGLVRRRPYHRNCECALHKLKGVCSTCGFRATNTSFPKKQAWDDYSLSLSPSKLSSQPPLLPYRSAPVLY
ncbi:hypothetical protein F3Y22_tig00002880pilonHSYRG00066 [Hibiscus syriacus]|uniref:Uncharacterized protein n=1 Tax=Hibiscus syriacus TaxID=106335 RepID=A0A6A3CNP2_HIBSY|nr:hypothetical protein F3Y22_tig00002880pilonHSYRG00066 [Hibiscus syriacus]